MQVNSDDKHTQAFQVHVFAPEKDFFFCFLSIRAVDKQMSLAIQVIKKNGGTIRLQASNRCSSGKVKRIYIGHRSFKFSLCPVQCSIYAGSLSLQLNRTKAKSTLSQLCENI